MKNLLIYLILLLPLISAPALAGQLVPPDDPRQSITYWKPHTLNADSDARVHLAHEVFRNLLRTWDDARVEPGLFVVESDAGPWAASLADGNILLSRSAIDVCMRLGEDRGDHLLAFILAHELAHQRVDDLWHHKFFRLAGSQSPQVQQRMLQGLDLSAGDLEDLERREAQADHDGLIIMATVGYDPQQVIAGTDFFTTWVESLWGDQCDSDSSAIPRQACRQAGSRAVRAQAQLQKVADQATLYELGIQQLVAGRFEGARRYLKAFGRDFPGRAVYTALGASYFIEALQVQQEISRNGLWQKPGLFFPVLLESLTSPADESAVGKRGSEKSRLDALVRKRSALLSQAIAAYERAQHLAPDHPLSYYMAALAYLMDENTFMTRGIVQGKYLPRFGSDRGVALLLAMTTAMEGDFKQAYRQHQELMESHDSASLAPGLISNNLLAYTASHNQAALLQIMGRSREAQQVWQELAATAKASGNSVLFSLALSRLQAFPASAAAGRELVKSLIDPATYVDGKTVAVSAHTTVWLEGDELNLNRYADGVRILLAGDNNSILAAWQPVARAGSSRLQAGDEIDRPLKVFGMPSRHVQMISGDYLAYDELGFGIHILNNKVAGWFMYPRIPGL